MAWFRVDDHLYSHPKWLALPKGSRALWVTAGSWCAGHFQAVMARQRHERVVLLAAWREGRL